MRVLGALAILIAAVLGWGSYNHYTNAANLRSELSKQSGFTKFIGDSTGLNEIDKARVAGAEDMGNKFAIGAGILGVVGLLLCAAGGKD